MADSLRVNKNRDDARAAREIEWERVPFENCEADYQFTLTPMASNTRRARSLGIIAEHEAESSEEYRGSEEDGWHVCGICGKFAEHGGMLDPAFADLPELNIRLGCKDICRHRRGTPCETEPVPAMPTKQLPTKEVEGHVSALTGLKGKKRKCTVRKKENVVTWVATIFGHLYPRISHDPKPRAFPERKRHWTKNGTSFALQRLGLKTK